MRTNLSSLLEAFESDLRACPSTKPVERQLARYRKKADLGDTSLSSVALANFRTVNELAGKVVVGLTSDEVSRCRDFIEHALWRANDGIQETFNLSTCLRDWRFGPGASRLTRSTHFVDKITDRAGSVSSSALPYAFLLRKMNPYLRAYDCQEGYEFRECNASQMSTVPKNEDTHRTICTEPLWNMSLQLAFGQVVERALCALGHDIRCQAELNKSLACAGSLYGDLATIDLKNASDLITPELIGLLWPPDCFSFMMAVRSSATLIDGELLDLNMISTMGNGFTFPVMTLTLLALSHTACNFRRHFVPWDKLAVFGDDIIVPTLMYEDVVSILERSGLCVNKDKSFTSGSFRESCGGDFDAGVDITPIYIKSLTTQADGFIVANQLLNWCSMHNVTCPSALKAVANFLVSNGGVFFVPSWHNPNQGVLSSCPPKRYRYLDIKPLVVRKRKERINPDIQMLISLGGYASDGDSTFLYSPRTDKSSSCVKKGYVPKGYSGWIGRKDPISKRRDFLREIYFS